MARSFRILGTLGRGAFGEVHLTEIRTDDDFVQTLAVKWLHPELSDDEELASRLRDEARLLGLLDHPNVVRVQGLTRLDGRLAVLMEAIRGRDLSGQHLPARAACQVGAAVAEALDAAWNAIPPGRDEPLRVVHRDIKPSNVMVTPRGMVKVMDFGVARATFEAREAQTRSQQYGTARYMAPERWLEGIAEGPSDVFSLGVTLVELVTGEAVSRPRLSQQGFAEDIETVLATVEPEILRAELARMLAFAPGDRPAAAEVAETLARLEVPGDDLRTWAASIEVSAAQPSERTGTVVVEQTGDTIALTATQEHEPALLASGTNAPTGAPPTLPLATASHATGTTAAVAADEAVATGLPAPGASRTPWPWVGLGATALGVFGVLLYLGSPAPTPPSAPQPSPVETTRPAPEPLATTPAPAAAPAEPLPEPVGSEPVPVPSPPRPEPVASAPAPRPSPAPTPTRPAPPPAPAPDPVSEPVPVETIPVRFLIAQGVTASTPAGPLPANGAAMLPKNQTVRVQGQGPDGPFGCTLPIGQASSTWHIGADGSCRERH